MVECSVSFEIRDEINIIETENDDCVNKEVDAWVRCFEDYGFTVEWKILKVFKSSDEISKEGYRLEMSLYKHENIDDDKIDEYARNMSVMIEDYGFTIDECDIGKIIRNAESRIINEPKI